MQVGDDTTGLDEEINAAGMRGSVTGSAVPKRTRSTRRRQDAPDLPKRKVAATTLGRAFTRSDGKVYRPSLFVTLTLPSYDQVPPHSFGDDLDPVNDGLGFLPFSNGVHDDLDDQPRRRGFREFVANGTLPAGYATEDGVALHYVGTELHDVVSVLPDRNAWFVEADDHGGIREKALPARCWVP